jgi:hypothetical protein
MRLCYANSYDSHHVNYFILYAVWRIYCDLFLYFVCLSGCLMLLVTAVSFPFLLLRFYCFLLDHIHF